jgi:hypothetical protein
MWAIYIVEQDPRAVQKWVHIPLSAKREDALEANRVADESFGESASNYDR